MNFKNSPSTSLKTRVTLVTLSVFVISILAMTIYVSRILREDLQRELSAQQFSTASFIAAEVNDELNERLDALEAVAKTISPTVLGNRAALQTLMELRPILPVLFNAGTFVTGIDGTAIASLPVSVGRVGVNYLERDHIAAALKEGKSRISKPVIGKVLQSPVVSMAVPIRDARGTVIGALAGVIDLGKPSFLDKVSDGTYGKTGSYFIVAPQYRLIITATDKSRIMQTLPPPGVNPTIDRFVQGFEGSAVLVNAFGKEVLSSSKLVPLAGWAVSVSLPTAEAFAPIHDLEQHVLIISAILTVLAGNLIWFVTTRMLQRQLSPMYAASKTLAVMSASEQPLQLLPVTSQDEIGQLIGGFNRLLETVGMRETALRESEERFKLMFRNHSAVMLLIKPESGAIIDANLAAEKFYGYSHEGLLSLNIYQINTLAPALIDVEIQAALEAKRNHFIFPHRLADGEIRTVEVYSTPITVNSSPLLYSIVQDITKRKRAEVALKKSSEQFLALATNIPGHVALVNANTLQYEFVNNAYEESFGIASENVIGHHVRDIIGEANFQYAVKYLDEAVAGKSVSYENTFDLTSGKRWNEVTYNPVFDADGHVSSIVALSYDITERKQFEQVQSYLLQLSSLNAGEDFFESLARYLASILGMDYVCIDTLHGDCLSARTLAVYNDGRIEENVEYTLRDTPCGDVVGKEICVFPRAVCSLFPQDAALQDLQAESYVGTTLWSLDMKPIGLIAVIGRKELTNSHFAETVLKLVATRAAGELERRQAEVKNLLVQQQLQQAQKLESLGVLAGGIAHDFNNILAIIICNCSLAQQRPQMAGELIPEIEEAAQRAAELCRQMLTYAGKSLITLKRIKMTALVEDMLKMLRATINQNVVMISDLSADMPSIKGDASQLRQIVMNLIINASEAIGETQGKINVSLTRTTIIAGQSDEDCLGTAIPPGGYACLEVTDNGCGMDEGTKQRIFEPFYTTKFTGRGLGMSAVLGIIKTHNGALQLTSEPGQGTTIKVYLPVLDNDFAGVVQHQQIAQPPWEGSGTVLLVEDEPQLIMVAKNLIKSLGFTVIEASNGKEALELYHKNSEYITTVVTDIGMPIMDGYELIHKLKGLAPELPIIVSSGFGDTLITSQIKTGEVAGFLSKPYNFDQLRQVLKKVFEGTKTDQI